MAEEKSTASGKKNATENGPLDAVGHEDGVFDGTVRYDGTVLVDRDIDGELVTVMTDKPRKGDKIQANTLDDESGKLVVSQESSSKPGATRMPGKS